jgi:hypothetical protein
MPTSGHENNEVEGLCDITEEILEEDGKGDTNIIIMGEWNSVLGIVLLEIYHIGTLLDHMA